MKASVNVGECEPSTTLLQLLKLTPPVPLVQEPAELQLFLPADLTWVQPSRCTEGAEPGITSTFKSESFRCVGSAVPEGSQDGPQGGSSAPAGPRAPG